MAQKRAIVIGGGIVGLSVASRLASGNGSVHVTLLEKERGLAMHQTGRNSGVIHSGIYYKPGSLKAVTCRAGRQALIEYCQSHRIAYEICGKVIVAADHSELPMLERIQDYGRANGIACRRISGAELREREPAVAGIEALVVDDAGIVDYPAMCAALANDLVEAGGDFHLGVRVVRIEARRDQTAVEGMSASGETKVFECDIVVNCAGLHSDRVAMLAGERPAARIIPFRGEYYRLRQGAPQLCRHLIYPVPDPAFPFLGVHLTRMINGGVECGPNAVLALGREAYSWRQFSLNDAVETAVFPGFWRLAFRHWRTSLGEIRRSLHLQSFVKALQRLVPEIRAEHLEPAPAGIRAQAVDRDGSMVDDFRFMSSSGCVHVLNAPSPAATAALEIGRHVVSEADRLLSSV